MEEREVHSWHFQEVNTLPILEPELTRARNRPDFTNTEPAAEIGPFPQWHDKKKIVAMDPLGHMAPWLFRDIIEKENG